MMPPLTHARLRTRFAPPVALLLATLFSQPLFAQGQDLDPRIVALVKSVSEERLAATLKKLESFETRSTLSSATSTTRGIGAARQWILDETLVFMCHAGEEQGLVGALLHAQKAEAEHIPIEAVFNNDIVGNDKGGNGILDDATIRVYSEDPEDSSSRSVIRTLP